MRNILKATTLENKFPLFTVENGCIVSKDADITVAFRVELPELFTVTAAEYEAIHSAWNKAVKVLPDYSIVHKQDWFIKENYAPDIQKDDLSFLSRSFERHFNERPFLNHTCYLFLTKTTKERSRMQSNFSTLCRGFLVPKEIKDKETVTKFLEAVGQFESIMNDSGFITLTRLTSDEITGTKETAGIVEKYFSLSQTDTTTLKDIQLNAEDMRIGDDILCLHTLSDAEDMPGKVECQVLFNTTYISYFFQIRIKFLITDNRKYLSIRQFTFVLFQYHFRYIQQRNIHICICFLTLGYYPQITIKGLANIVLLQVRNICISQTTETGKDKNITYLFQTFGNHLLFEDYFYFIF